MDMSKAPVQEGKEPLLPLPSPSTFPSPPPPRRPALLSRTWLRALLAVLALGSLWLQLSPSGSPPRSHAALRDARGYLARLRVGSAPHGRCPYSRHIVSHLSHNDIVDTLLNVPTAAGAKNASKECAGPCSLFPSRLSLTAPRFPPPDTLLRHTSRGAKATTTLRSYSSHSGRTFWAPLPTRSTKTSLMRAPTSPAVR